MYNEQKLRRRADAPVCGDLPHTRSLLPAFSRENCEMESNIMLEAKHKVNLSEKAYDEIKDAICKGKVMPGDILSESQLASQLGMSRTPVREALRMLATENFVEVKNGIGAYVKSLSSKDMEDLYEVRCLLEVQAIKTSIYRITNDEIDAFERHFQALLDACGARRTPRAGGIFRVGLESSYFVWWSGAPTSTLRALLPATIQTCAATSLCPLMRSTMCVRVRGSIWRY